MKLRSSNLTNGSPTGEKFPRKGRGLGHMTLLKILNPLPFPEWMKLHCLNLASGSTTTSPTPKVKISPRKARGLDHLIVFFFNFANASTMASATPGVKNSRETDVVSVT